MNKELIEKFNLMKELKDEPESGCSTIEEISKFEKKYKVTFPDEYKYFLINVGGGDFDTPEKDLVYLVDENQTNLPSDAFIGCFISLNELYEENKLMHYPIKYGLLVFAGTTPNDAFTMCIDKKSKDYGKIYYFLSGYHPPFQYFEGGMTYDEYPLLANSFEEFILRLTILEE